MAYNTSVAGNTTVDFVFGVDDTISDVLAVGLRSLTGSLEGIEGFLRMILHLQNSNRDGRLNIGDLLVQENTLMDEFARLFMRTRLPKPALTYLSFIRTRKAHFEFDSANFLVEHLMNMVKKVSGLPDDAEPDLARNIRTIFGASLHKASNIPVLFAGVAVAFFQSHGRGDGDSLRGLRPDAGMEIGFGLIKSVVAAIVKLLTGDDTSGIIDSMDEILAGGSAFLASIFGPARTHYEVSFPFTDITGTDWTPYSMVRQCTDDNITQVRKYQKVRLDGKGPESQVVNFQGRCCLVGQNPTALSRAHGAVAPVGRQPRLDRAAGRGRRRPGRR